MSDHIYVIPRREIVLDPRTKKPLPKEGARVPRTTYWLRRLRDEDVAVGEPTKAEKPAKGAKKSED